MGEKLITTKLVKFVYLKKAFNFFTILLFEELTVDNCTENKLLVFQSQLVLCIVFVFICSKYEHSMYFIAH